MIIPRLAAVCALVATVAPLAAASCLPSCEVGSTAFAFVTPATVIASGDNVTWTSTDADAHTAFSEDFCLRAYIEPQDPGEAWFRIQAGALQSADAPGGPWRTCTQAEAAGEGFVLTYKCFYHPTLQHGVLVVTP